MRRLPQSTARVVTLKVYLSSDHVTAATSKTVAITISKNGGAFANPNAGATNATEIASGWYKVTLGTGDTDTLGDLVVRGTATACDDSEQVCDVVAVASDIRIKKNTALANFPIRMTSSVDHFSPATGLTITGQVLIDGGSFVALANAITEEANGWYKVSLAAADTNGDVLAFKFTATGADQLDFTIVTQP